MRLTEARLEELKYERYDALHALLVARVLFRELRAHHVFFVVQFDPEAYEHEDESEHSRDVCLFHPRRHEHGKQAGVDGMANQPIGTAHNQFVIFLQRDRAAPVASENGPGPETESKSAKAQDRGGNKNGIGLGNKVGVEWRPETVAAEHEIPAEKDRDNVTQTPGRALVVDG